jgi:hypothetical protein
MPSDDEVKEGFYQSKLVNKQAAGILYFIEASIRDRSLHSTSLLGLNRYSLEHIMPKKWENHWGRLLNETDKINRNRKILRSATSPSSPPRSIPLSAMASCKSKSTASPAKAASPTMPQASTPSAST